MHGSVSGEMAQRVEAIVKPNLLIWARESAGLSVEEAASKARIKPEHLVAWEQGVLRPTINQLRTLGNIYKRPLAVFYLPTPPKEFSALRDFRRLPGEVVGTESPQLRLEVRNAHYRRDMALDLYADLGESPRELSAITSLANGPEETANYLRQLLGVTYQEQVGWRGLYEPFNHWRSALENLGILVFQVTEVDVSEMRGFSIGDRPLPVIAVNIKDSPRGRIFTMLHEFTHITLQQGGLCDLEEGGGRRPEEQRVEVFCNWLAGAIIVPMEHLLTEDIVVAKRGDPAWADEELNLLVGRYSASREVILRRLLIAGCTTEEFYRKKREELQEQYAALRKASSGFFPPYSKAVSTAGHPFVRLVLNSYYKERITASDLSDLLGVRLKHLPRIEKTVIGHNAESGVGI